MIFFILDDNDKPVETTCAEWTKWREEHSDRLQVKLSEVGDVTVSTVFVGLNPVTAWLGGGLPLVFETLITGGEYNGTLIRHPTKRVASIMHDAWVVLLSEDLLDREPPWLPNAGVTGSVG